jgi:hypothetical protein
MIYDKKKLNVNLLKIYFLTQQKQTNKYTSKQMTTTS